jgi:hypothetical protein
MGDWMDWYYSLARIAPIRGTTIHGIVAARHYLDAGSVSAWQERGESP